MKLEYNLMYNELITPNNVIRLCDTLENAKIMTYNYDQENAFLYAASYEESYSPWFAYCSKDNCFYETNCYNWDKKQWNFLKVEGLTTIKEASEYFSIGIAIIDSGGIAPVGKYNELKDAWDKIHKKFGKWKNK